MNTVNEMIKNSDISKEDFFALEISAWQSSTERNTMLTAREYYLGNHDILDRKRTAIGRDGSLEEVNNLPNNKVVDNMFARFIDQKKNYLLGKPITIVSDEESYYKELKAIFDVSFLRMLKMAGEEALLGGIAWLYPYLNEFGMLKFKVFPAHEICPFWKDSSHTEIDAAARVYSKDEYEGTVKRTITNVEIYELSGMTSYKLEGNKLIKLEDEKPYVTKGKMGYNWPILPLIPIKLNAKEIPLISKIKQLQDSLNLILSDFINNMEENVRNTILVLKNYDGTDLGEFRKNLSSFGAIKTRTQEGSSGGVDVLRIEVNAENYNTIIQMLIRAMCQNARGFDSRDERMSGNPNQMNIRSMYSDIDLDANDMESEILAAFEEIMAFCKVYLKAFKNLKFETSEAKIIFNRDILVNETETIENCVKSMSILSLESIIAEHPWVSDYLGEKKKVENQNNSLT